MKKTSLLVFCIFYVLNAFSQDPPDFYNLMQKPNADFFQIKSEVEDYLENHPSSDEDGYKEAFERWEYFWKGRIATNGNESSFGKFTNWQNQVNGGLASLCSNPSTHTSDWKIFGPKNYSTMSMGIVSVVESHPDPLKPNRMYAGTTNSGLWMTEDITQQNPVWVNLTNSSYFPGLGINWILIDPVKNSNNYNDIYLATGFTRVSPGYGVGVIKSSDDGQTWIQTGFTASSYTNQIIVKLLAAPRVNITDPLSIYAITNTETYRTIDAGISWAPLGMIQVNYPHSMNLSDDPTEYPIDIEFDPQNPNMLWISGKFLLSYNIATATWTNNTQSLTLFNEYAPAAYFLPERWMCMELCVSAGHLYALYADIQHGARKLYIDKLNSGVWGNFLKTTSTDLNQLDNGIFEMSPTDPNTIYIEGPQGGTTSPLCSANNRAITKSINGGSTWFKTMHYWAYDLYNNGSSMVSTHADIRSLKIISTVNGSQTADRLIAGTDGGVLYCESASVSGPGCTGSTNYQTVAWRNCNGNYLPLGQFFGISGIENKPDFLIGGSQDNGEWSYNNGVWNNICSPFTFGDAYNTATDYSNPPNCYVEKGAGTVLISTNYGQTYGTSLTVPNAVQNYFPIEMYPSDQPRLDLISI